jgi:hypothetical protein
MKVMYFSMQGLGDHISANGLVRSLLYKHECDKLDILVWNTYIDTIRFMYRDEPRINPISIASGRELNDLKQILNTNKYNIIYFIGHEMSDSFLKEIKDTKIICTSFAELCRIYGPNNDCHQLYYKGAGIDFSTRFDKFYYIRDLAAEEALYKKYNPNNLPYIFIHDDKNRGYSIEIDSKYFIIKNNPTENIFNYYKLLQNAEEIHCMESSFRCLLETIELKNTKLFLHHYIRKTTPFLDNNNKIISGATQKVWNIVL